MRISEEDVLEAMRLWRQTVPPAYQGLLDAKGATSESDLEKLILAGVLFYFAGQYLNPLTGAIISFMVVRDTLESVIDATGAKMEVTTQQMMNGEISKDKWEEDMQRDIALLLILATLAAHGGLAQMNPLDWAAAAVRINAQYKFLAAFGSEIAVGSLDGRTLARARLYAEAGRSEYEHFRTEQNKREGWQEERRFLEDGAEHCDGCIGESALGWQPIGTLEPIGEQECGVNCKCTKQYRRMGLGGWIVTDG